MSKQVITFGINKIVLSIEMLTKMSILFNILMVLQSHSIVNGGPAGQYFITEPKNVTVKSGSELTLPCSIAKKQGTCQWTKDGFGLGPEVDLPGWPRYSMATSGLDCHLKIDPVLAEDEGVYQCQVGGILGMAPLATPPAKVRVVSEPGDAYIKQAKVDEVIVVKEGDEVILDCESQGGRPAAEILWSSAGIKVTDIIKRVEKMKDGKTFKTSSRLRFIPTKSVSITCSAFNEEFNHPKTSRPVQIEVKKKPDIEMIFDKVNVAEGESLDVKCQVTNTDQDTTYNWFVNNQRVEGFAGSILKLEPVTRNQNNAEIKCTVRNSVGETEITKTLDVRFSPAIVKHPENKNVEVGEKVQLSCSAEGNPEPKYVWLKRKSEDMIGEGQQLSLVASEDTEGEYTCRVYNEGFESVSSMPALVMIKRKPRIHAELVKYGTFGEDAVLQCQVHSFSNKTKVLWTKNHEPINLNGEKYQVFHRTEDNKSQIESNLVIFKLTDGNFGEYGCFASNQIGTDYKIISLKKAESVNYISISMCVNIALGLVVLLCIFIYYQHKKSLREKEKVKNGYILPTTIYNNTFQPIYKNEDTSVFDKLLENGKDQMKNIKMKMLNEENSNEDVSVFSKLLESDKEEMKNMYKVNLDRC